MNIDFNEIMGWLGKVADVVTIVGFVLGFFIVKTYRKNKKENKSFMFFSFGNKVKQEIKTKNDK